VWKAGLPDALFGNPGGKIQLASMDEIKSESPPWVFPHQYTVCNCVLFLYETFLGLNLKIIEKNSIQVQFVIM
jgi:hypothetical protein